MRACRVCRHYAVGTADRCVQDGGELLEAATPSIAPGERIGPYVVERALGAGDTGVLLVARRGEDDAARYVVKALHSSAGEIDVRRPLLESVAKLTATGLLPIVDVVADTERLCAVRPFVEGKSLAFVLRAAGPMGESAAVELGRVLAGTLAKTHEVGIYHGDVRPGHVMLAPDARPESALLVDLGSPSPPCGLSAPELHDGQASTAATDVYGLCMTLYVALAGRSPFRADDPEELGWMVRNSPPPPLRVVRRDEPASGAIEKLINWGLEKEPTKRPTLDRVARLLGAMSGRSQASVQDELREAPDRAPEEGEDAGADDEPEADDDEGPYEDAKPTLRMFRRPTRPAGPRATGQTDTFFAAGEEMDREVKRLMSEEAKGKRENAVAWVRLVAFALVALALLGLAIYGLSR